METAVPMKEEKKFQMENIVFQVVFLHVTCT